MIAGVQADRLLPSDPNQGDLRRRTLALTDLGRALLSEVIPAVNAHSRHYANRLTGNDKKNLLRLLSKLHFSSPDRAIRRSILNRCAATTGAWIG